MASYLTASIKRSYAESFLAELERNENQYFLFIGRGITWADDNSPPQYTNTVANEYDVMNNIIGYKKLDPSGIIFALPRYKWENGTTYDQYDDAVDLFDDTNPSVFYVVNSANHIYKCISNGGGVASTTEPSVVLPGAQGVSDGYRWQYLSTVRESDLPYELTDYIPVDFAYSSADTETVNQYNAQIQAINGTLTKIEVSNSSGASAGVYPYTISTETSESSTINPIKISGFTSDASGKYVTVTDPDSRADIDSNSNSNVTNYVGYIMRVKSNTANQSEAGNYGVITAVSPIGGVNGYKFTISDDAINFSVTTPLTQTFTAVAEILPYIRIIGNGTGAYAYPTMNSDKNIVSVNVVNGGRGYSRATAESVSKKETTSNHPTFRPVLSPKGGHGSNILRELNVNDVLILIEIDENDTQKILEGGSYRQFGIIKNPRLLLTGEEAGKSNVFYRDISLTPVSGEPELSQFSGDSANLIVGSESYSVAKVVSRRSLNSNTVVLKTVNSSGKFITRQDRPNDYLVTVNNSVNNFQQNETVTQTIPSGTVISYAGQLGGISYSFPIETTGVVLSNAGATLTVRLTSNSGLVSGQPLIGKRSQENKTVTTVSPVYGERVYVTGLSSGTPDFLSRSQYSVVDVGSAYSDSTNQVSYTGLHALELTTSVNSETGGFDVTSFPLTQNSYSVGDFVEQGITGAFGHYASGTVYRWDFTNSARGNLYLTNVLGSFRNVVDHGLSGSTLGNYLVASVTPPDIDPTSGDVLYIDNVRPIQRFVGQQEEFRLRLGF